MKKSRFSSGYREQTSEVFRTNHLRSILAFIALALLLGFPCPSARAATYLVTTVADADIPTPGMLRWALGSANTNANLDIIRFAPHLTSGPEPSRIRLVRPLPFLLHPVHLDAIPGDVSGPRYPTIEITPATGTFLDDGLRVAHSSIIRGIALFGFGRQMYIIGSGNLIDSCYFGTDVPGNGSTAPPASDGLDIGNDYNRIIHCVPTASAETSAWELIWEEPTTWTKPSRAYSTIPSPTIIASVMAPIFCAAHRTGSLTSSVPQSRA